MTYRKGANDGSKTFEITLGDYSSVTVSGDPTPSGTWSENNTKYTVSSTDLESATNGDHTYTFSFGEGMTISKKNHSSCRKKYYKRNCTDRYICTW